LTFGLFHGQNQVGFQCFAEYTPWTDRTKQRKMHSNRTVIHPDYCGFGLGMKLINVTSRIVKDAGHDVWGKFSNVAIYKAMSREKDWVLRNVEIDKAAGTQKMSRTSGFRSKTKTWSFQYQPATEGTERNG
jgi:hypothetical protein